MLGPLVPGEAAVTRELLFGGGVEQMSNKTK